MFTRCSKIGITLVLLCAIFGLDIRLADIVQFVRSSAPGEVVDRLFMARQNPNVIDNFGIKVPHAEAASDSSQREYFLQMGPITGSTVANYVYGAMFNPSASGRTIVIKRILARSNAVNTGTYAELSMRRITAITGGTQITAANIPKKNSNSANSIAEMRHTNPTPTYTSSAQARLLGQPMAGAVGLEYSMREITFGSNDEKLVLQPGEGIALAQEAAGTVQQRITLQIEWEELTSTPAAENEYMLAIQRVEVAATAGYAYNTFFNPSGSGRTALVKRIWFGTETCDTAAVYTNNIQLRRISAMSAGTVITADNIPKKNSSSPNSVMDVRHTNVTVTQVGGADARLGLVTPCGAAGEETGWARYDFHTNDEPLVLQPNEGIALISETAGDIDQIVRMFVEWEEVVSAPTARNEYLWASNRVEVAAALGANFYTLFNPIGSGRTGEVKRLVMRVNADTAATYSNFNFQRISTTTGGTAIAAADIPKKHTGSSNSIMQIRWCGAACASTITPTYTGNRSITASVPSDSGIMKALGPGAVSQAHGQFELVFTPEEPLVLKAGEGIGFYLNFLAGDIDQYVKIAVEWGEVASVPATRNQYLIDIGPIPGGTTATYNYATFFNPTASSRTAIIKRSALRVNAIGTATYSPIQIKRISAASAGTQITAANIPKKNSSSTDSIIEIRRTNVTATYSQTADAQFVGVVTPGAVAASTAMGKNAWRSMYFENDEEIIIKPGEGIVLSNNAVANANHRVYWNLEWEEVAVGSTPVAENEYLLTTPLVTGNAATDYVYSSIFNPVSSNRLYVIKHLGLRADRTGTLVAPGYIPITLRPITAASGGTLISSANIPRKHASSSTPTAEIRRAGVTVSYPQATTSRYFSGITPGLVRQSHAILEQEHIFGDELVLYPGEGIALYQESNAGDNLMNYAMTIGWSEVAIPVEPQSITFSMSDTAVGFGTLLPGGTRYATGDSLGSGTDTVPAHSISVTTNATDGYVVYVAGTTLTCVACAGATITPVGGTAVAPSIGTEQFGVRATVVTGSGSVTAPYNTANWAFDTAAFPDAFASGAGDEVTTEYGIRYMANIASNSEPGSYSGQVTYIVTSTF